MKKNHQQLSTVLFTVTVLALLVSSLAHADNIYVSCYGSGTIEKFDSSGNRSTFASGLLAPWGLAFDSRGNLYAGDRDCGTIEKFDLSGNRSTFASGLSDPWGLAFDSRGNLVGFYTDDSGMHGFVYEIPEPATLLLFGLGGLMLRKRK